MPTAMQSAVGDGAVIVEHGPESKMARSLLKLPRVVG